jgi:hypothetical protein
MATKIRNWSSTAGSNNSTPPDGAPEGMAPSTVNDVIRENMAAVRDWYIDPAWVDFGYTYAYVGATQFKIAGVNVTANYPVARRVRAIGSLTGTIYGTISVSSFATDTTITVVWDSGSLSNETLAISAGMPSLGSPIAYNNLKLTGLLALTDITNQSQATILGRASGAGTGAVTALTAAQVQTIVGAASLPCEFRLTLTTNVPVTTADVTGATTIYCTPYCGNRIALYDGSSTWNTRTSAQFSVALGTLTTNRMYDVFCYDNAGTPTLELLVWTSNTARATALVFQDGVLVKSGATTRRYMGSFCTTSTTTTEDSMANRFLWNNKNRVRRNMGVAESTANWAYSTATFRQANANTANQLNFVIGYSEDAVIAGTSGIQVYSSTASARAVAVGIGLDTTTTDVSTSRCDGTASSGFSAIPRADYCEIVAVGKHYLSWLERGAGTDTQTFYARVVAAGSFAGITGHLLA